MKQSTTRPRVRVRVSELLASEAAEPEPSTLDALEPEPVTIDALDAEIWPLVFAYLDLTAYVGDEHRILTGVFAQWLRRMQRRLARSPEAVRSGRAAEVDLSRCSSRSRSPQRCVAIAQTGAGNGVPDFY